MLRLWVTSMLSSVLGKGNVPWGEKINASVRAFWVLEALKLMLNIPELAFPRTCIPRAPQSPRLQWSTPSPWSLVAMQERCKVLGVSVICVPAVSCVLLQVLKASLWVFALIYSLQSKMRSVIICESTGSCSTNTAM